MTVLSQVPDLDAIRSAFEGLHVIDVTAAEPTSLYELEGDSLDAVRSFADVSGKDVVVAERMFLKLDDLLIPDELCRGLPLELIGGVQLDSHIFNRDIRALDLSRPVELRLFVLYEGRAFGVHFVDPELDSLRSMSPAERVESFTEVRRKRLKDRSRLTPKQEEPMHEKFSEVLVLDRLYRDLRTDEERVYYVMKVARRPGNDQLRMSIMKDDGNGFSMEKIRKVISIATKKTDLSRNEPTQMVFEKE